MQLFVRKKLEMEEKTRFVFRAAKSGKFELCGSAKQESNEARRLGGFVMSDFSLEMDEDILDPDHSTEKDGMVSSFT